MDEPNVRHHQRSAGYCDRDTNLVVVATAELFCKLPDSTTSAGQPALERKRRQFFFRQFQWRELRHRIQGCVECASWTFLGTVTAPAVGIRYRLHCDQRARSIERGWSSSEQAALIA